MAGEASSTRLPNPRLWDNGHASFTRFEPSCLELLDRMPFYPHIRLSIIIKLSCFDEHIFLISALLRLLSAAIRDARIWSLELEIWSLRSCISARSTSVHLSMP
jgi:predicted YcjX-like family ATPase